MHFYRCNDCGYESQPIRGSQRRILAISKHVRVHGCSDNIKRWNDGKRATRNVTCLECGKEFEGTLKSRFCKDACVRKHRRRVSRIAGFCTGCNAKKPPIGQRLCDTCRLTQRNASKRWMEKQKELGLCVHCTNVAVYGMLCYRHYHIRLVRQKKHSFELRVERAKKGLCVNCGKEKSLSGHRWGQSCIEKDRLRRHRALVESEETWHKTY